ncbi:hypothetical protein EVAR_19031_1 [Eumeta japonica]|uniref:Uncharacterized protein n=1 Tax=Eumeta variegata TaxID=151549 RepID=A0A4C1V7W2_EUMVA|nr:hypothetical protein EVAR_19031_1 [Eumeta japonica]
MDHEQHPNPAVIVYGGVRIKSRPTSPSAAGRPFDVWHTHVFAPVTAEDSVIEVVHECLYFAQTYRLGRFEFDKDFVRGISSDGRLVKVRNEESGYMSTQEKP